MVRRFKIAHLPLTNTDVNDSFVLKQNTTSNIERRIHRLYLFDLFLQLKHTASMSIRMCKAVETELKISLRVFHTALIYLTCYNLKTGEDN